MSPITIFSLFSWLQGVDSQPGFSKDAFSSLQRFASSPDTRSEYSHCTLLLDSMHIHAHRDIDKSTDDTVGCITLAEEDTTDEVVATEALVFMAVGLKGRWKVPLGYFFVKGISGAVLAQLIQHALTQLHEAGVRAMAVTMDGCPTNLAALKKLGCDVKAGTSHSFPHPADSTLSVYVYMDPCHMLKLLRNMLAECSVVYTKWGAVNWSYVEDLHAYQMKEGLKAGNKISERHVNWQQQKMKVSLNNRLYRICPEEGLATPLVAPIFFNAFWLVSLGFIRNSNC